MTSTRLLTDSATIQQLEANEGLGSPYGLITSTAQVTLSALTRYGLKTSEGALSLKLPAISGLNQGCWIEVYDVDFEAATNAVTITPSGSDQIIAYGQSTSSQTLDVSGSRALFVVNGTAWSMVA